MQTKIAADWLEQQTVGPCI